MSKWVEVKTISWKTHLIEVGDDMDENSDDFWDDFSGCCINEYDEASVVCVVPEDAVDSFRYHADEVYPLN